MSTPARPRALLVLGEIGFRNHRYQGLTCPPAPPFAWVSTRRRDGPVPSACKRFLPLLLFSQLGSS